MEKDDEVKGNGNSYDFGARIYDSRLGRWLSVDPLAPKFPDIGPYGFVSNNPILFIDSDGRELKIYGEVAAFNKLKSLVGMAFEGLIELKRDENNVVTMHIVSTETSSSQLEVLKKTETFKQLSAIISDPGTTSLDLVDGESGIAGGAFRGGTFDGRQSLDVGDAYARKDWLISSGLGAAIHEIVEAYEDQVKNGFVEVKTQEEFMAQYRVAHDVATKAQGMVDGFKAQYNQVSYERGIMKPIGQIFTVKDNENGGEDWMLTTISFGRDKTMILENTVKIENVKINDAGQVGSYDVVEGSDVKNKK